jgi:hypothetical protein
MGFCNVGAQNQDNLISGKQDRIVKNFTATDGVELKEYVEAIIEAQRQYFESSIAAVKEATTIAAISMEKRLDGMNEFRAALKDQSGRMATTSDVDLKILRLEESVSVRLKAIEERQRALLSFKDQMAGRASAGAVYLSYAIAGLGLTLAIIDFIMKM